MWLKIITLVTFFVTKHDFCTAKNYDRLLERILAENRAAREEYILNNPHHRELFDQEPETDYFYKMKSDDSPNDEVWNRPTHEEFNWIDLTPDTVDETKNIRSSMQPTVRRTEFAPENHLYGVHKVSGGSSEVGKWLDYALLGAGLQDDDGDNIQGSSGSKIPSAFKNDSLPSYCDPPNPCPIGYDPETLPTPCDPQIKLDREANRLWILRKMLNGECTCDREHMDNCELMSRISNYRDEELSAPREPEFNPYMQGLKRKRLVAKKATISKRRAENPYMQGIKRKRLVAKKSSPFKTRNPSQYMTGRTLKRVIKKNGPN